MIRILLQSRQNLFSKPGGDTTQIVSLKNGLTSLGCTCHISTELKPKLTDYDIVHLFNITRVHETHVQMCNAKIQGKPVVCTAIYHDLEEYNRKGRYGLGKLIFKLVKNDGQFEHIRGLFNMLRDKSQIAPVMKQWKMGYRAQQEAVLCQAEKIVFGSKSEKKMVFARFENINKRISHKIIMVHSAIAGQVPDPVLFQKRFGLRDFILCVGRIEDLKNQLNLILAAGEKKIPLVLIGRLNMAHRGYCRRILRYVEKNPNLYYMGPMENPMLSSAFAAARVHVLPSWFETTGLTSLEAGLANCNVVSTNRGYTRDYLKDYAWYCDPSSRVSIKTAVMDAYQSPLECRLKEHIIYNHHPEEMIEETIALYQSVLK